MDVEHDNDAGGDDACDGDRPRAMHGFSIPAYTYRSCKCGKIWLGPAYACMDDDGYFWNCKGCADRFAEDPHWLRKQSIDNEGTGDDRD